MGGRGLAGLIFYLKSGEINRVGLINFQFTTEKSTPTNL